MVTVIPLSSVGMHSAAFRRLIVCTAVFAAVAAVPAMAEEEERPEINPDIKALEPVPPQNPPAAWISPDPLSPVTDLTNAARQPLESIGISVELGVTSILQAASDSTGSRPPVLWSFSYDFAGQWTLVHDSPLGYGGLGWLVEGGRPIGDRRDTDLSGEIGSLLGVNDDLDGEPVELTELWWSQHLMNEQLTVTFGKINPTVFYDGNRVANSEVDQFLATPLVNNSAVAFPDNGLGVNVTFEPVEWFYVSAGVQDARAVATQSGFNTIDEHELFYAGEIGFTPMIGEMQGNYRFMAWTSEVEDEHGRGFAVSFDQDVSGLLGLPGAGVVPFFRYGYSEGDLSDFDHQISAGVGFEGLLGRPDDLLAIGYVWADPVDPTLRQESLMEIFYRMQLTDSLQLTPDVQFIFDPAGNTDHDVVTVMGLRLQMIF